MSATRSRRLSAALVPAVLSALALLGPAGAGNAQEEARAVAPATVVLVRHAEKGDDDPRDPSLSAAGVERAQVLAGLFGEAGVTHLFSTQYKRTRETLAPLAEASGVELEVVPASEMRRQVELLKGLAPGGLAVVCGHSNTVPAIARALGVELSRLTESAHGPMLGEGEYERLFVLTLPPAGVEGVTVRTLELRYGEL